MANHYLKSLELLDEVDDLEKSLQREYLRNDHRRDRIADLHARIGRCLKRAQIHAQLAEVKALDDLAVARQYEAVRP